MSAALAQLAAAGVMPVATQTEEPAEGGAKSGSAHLAWQIVRGAAVVSPQVGAPVEFRHDVPCECCDPSI